VPGGSHLQQGYYIKVGLKARGLHSFALIASVLLVFVTMGCARPATPTPPALPAPSDFDPANGPTSTTSLASATLPRPISTVETRSSAGPSAATRTAPDFCQLAAAAPGRPRYRFEVIAQPAVHRLIVQQQLTLTDPDQLASGEIVFNVPANHAAGIFNLKQVALAGVAEHLAPQLSGSTLRIGLPPAVRTASAATVCLSYTLDLPPAAAGGITGASALAWSELGDVAGLWYPVLAPYDPDNGWRPIPYHPVGDPIVYPVADYAVTVQAPLNYEVIGPGTPRRQGDAWQFELLSARGFAFIVSDRLTVSSAQVNGIPVSVYHRPAEQAAAQDVLRALEEALPLFAQTYGPYPYDSLTIVEAAQFGGMEYSALITFSSQWFAEYQRPAPGVEFGADSLIRFVVHETGHQWWYGTVGNDQAYEPWLDEGLARFGEHLYYEKLHPNDLSWWAAPSAGMKTLPINRPIYDFADTAGYVQAVYVSSARFLLDVRDKMGDKAFYDFLQDYYRQYRDQIVTQAQFLSLLRSYAGADLDHLLPLYFDPVPDVASP